jgi:hypothetical protein
MRCGVPGVPCTSPPWWRWLGRCADVQKPALVLPPLPTPTPLPLPLPCPRPTVHTQRCAMVKNTTVLAASSAAAAARTITAALEACRQQMGRLEDAGRTALPVYSSLRAKFDALQRHQRELQGLTV